MLWEIWYVLMRNTHVASHSQSNVKTIRILSSNIYYWDLRAVKLYPFEHPEKMSIYVEYNLTFFEAMRKADEGWIVSNDDWSKSEYVMHDGIPCYFGNGKIASFTKSDLQAKWKVVRKVE